MQQHDLIKLFALPLEAANVDYVVTGSVAMILYAEPRLTHDIDIVVHLKIRDAQRIPEIFPANEYYCPPLEIILSEIRRPVRAQFNIIHHESGFKAGIFPFGEDPLHEWAFAQKRRTALETEYSVWLAPPEYVILRKMQYFAEGGSDKHVRDIRDMLAIMKDGLDLAFIEAQALRLGLAETWLSMRER